MTHKAVLFDLDGTLLDTLDDLADSVNVTLKSLGLPTHPVDAYRYFVGDGAEKMVRRALPDTHRVPARLGPAVAQARAEYARRWAAKTRPYEGVPDLLNALSDRGVPMAILSNKPDDFTKLVVSKLLNEWEFVTVVGARDGVALKPDPTAALEIADGLDIPPAQFLYVGDTDTDMKTAAAAGMYAAGALWGFRDADELLATGADALAERPPDLLKYVDE